MNFPQAELLTLEELDRVCGAFVRQGPEAAVTGGEPLVRRDIMTLFRSLDGISTRALDELTLPPTASSPATPAATRTASSDQFCSETLDPAKCRDHPPRPAWPGARCPPPQSRRAPGQDQHGGAARVSDELDDIVAWCAIRLRPRADRELYRGRSTKPAGTVFATIAGAGAAGAALDPRRDRYRTGDGALCGGAKPDGGRLSPPHP